MDPHQQLTALQTIVATLQTQVGQLQAEIQSLRTTSTPSRPKPALPDPEKFNGQSHRFDTWLPSIRAKLRVDGTAIGDSIAQFYYVFLNLESHVQAMVLPQLAQAEESTTWDFNTILGQLSRVYDNPNKVQEAEDKLLSLRQGTDSIPAYISKFERVLYEARGQDWPDINKISIFRNGLSSIIRNRLSQQLILPSIYPEFIRIVQQLAGRASSSTNLSANPPGLSTGSGNSHLHSHPQVLQRTTEPMDIGSIGINALDIAAIEGGPSSVANAIINADNQTPRARSISPTRREQYRQEGRCVRCGSYDHWVGNCTLQPHKPERRQVVRRRTPVDLAALDPVDLNFGSDNGWDTGDELERLQKGEI
jgi:hypothetical protein